MNTIIILEEYANKFIKELKRFDYEISGTDFIWKVLFKDQKEKWRYAFVTKYQNTYYINNIEGELGTLEVNLGKSVKIIDAGTFSEPRQFYPDEPMMKEWTDLIIFANKWLKFIEKDWIKANKLVITEYPFEYRYGTVPNRLITESLLDVYRIDNKLGKAWTRKLVRLVEKGYCRKNENFVMKTMTTARYFDYCKIAYNAVLTKASEKDKALSGEEMYRRYADGRHEGLLDINPDSEKEFADWIDSNHPKRSIGGHPWEIIRGGNTTHIDLIVRRPSYYQNEGFVVELRGESFIRLVETLKMFLAIYNASLPVTISNSENIRKRLLCQDNIGIVPEHNSLHRANQHFEKSEDVFEVMHYHDLGRYKRKITPFIRWEALPVLKLKNI
ncbi:MAG: hypothetical protein K8R68_02165 [Bacteroidales bacterium]|nr:hypothetical protein [Bacteroidales bacterium]